MKQETITGRVEVDLKQWRRSLRITETEESVEVFKRSIDSELAALRKDLVAEYERLTAL